MIGEKALSCFLKSDINGFLNGKTGILMSKKWGFDLEKIRIPFSKNRELKGD